MPLYVYRCPKCKRVTEEFRTMENAKRMPDCPMCESVMERAFDIEKGKPRNAGGSGGVSVNAGVGVKQVAEGNRLLAGHGLLGDARFNAEGSLEYKDRKTFLKVLDMRGMSNKDEVCGGH